MIDFFRDRFLNVLWKGHKIELFLQRMILPIFHVMIHFDFNFDVTSLDWPASCATRKLPQTLRTYSPASCHHRREYAFDISKHDVIPPNAELCCIVHLPRPRQHYFLWPDYQIVTEKSLILLVYSEHVYSVDLEKTHQGVSFGHLPELIRNSFLVIHKAKLEHHLKYLTQSIDSVLRNQTSYTQQPTLQFFKLLPFHSSDKFLGDSPHKFYRRNIRRVHLRVRDPVNGLLESIDCDLWCVIRTPFCWKIQPNGPHFWSRASINPS
jgi:hypothetical protein